jgi:hypothetical protein
MAAGGVEDELSHEFTLIHDPLAMKKAQAPCALESHGQEKWMPP